MIFSPFSSAILLNSWNQPSPYASAKPMKPTVFTPASAMCAAIAVDIMMSFCGVLKIHFFFASTGSTMRADAAIEIIGVCDSAATSIIASEFGVVVDPISTSTLLSVMSLRAFVTAVVVSDASSSTM